MVRKTAPSEPVSATGLLILSLCLLAAGCTKESRTVGPEQPQTPPHGQDDPRTSYFQDNLYQVSQGGRYFSWYGCAACHGDEASGTRNLVADLESRPRSFTRLYGQIAGHPNLAVDYGKRIPVEQLWQITAYVRQLPQLKPEMRRRQDLDQAGETQGASWNGAVR
jgi:hypothetical protein